ncbi:hypothetical protein CapIbe_008724 [Capra ibex]
MAADGKGEAFLLQDWDGDASLAQTTFRMEVSGKSDCVNFITIYPMPSPEPGSATLVGIQSHTNDTKNKRPRHSE